MTVFHIVVEFCFVFTQTNQKLDLDQTKLNMLAA